MRFKNLDLNLLVALDTLLKEKSITKAAEKLHLSPSAVSSSLSRLRDFYDDELLMQVGRRMEITPLGESLQLSVIDILNRIDSSLIAKPGFDPKESDRTFSILCSGYTQALLVSTILSLLEKESDSITFEFRQQIADPKTSLERGETDFLIIPSIFISPDHPYEELYDEEFCCVVWNESQYAHTGVSIDAFFENRHIVLRPATGRKDFMEKAIMAKFSRKRKIAATTYSFSAIPAMVIGTELIAVVHKRLAQKYETALPIKTFDVPFRLDMPMHQCIQWHKYRSSDPGMVWVRGLIAKAVELVCK